MLGCGHQRDLTVEQDILSVLLVLIHSICDGEVIINKLALPYFITIHAVRVIRARCKEGLDASATGDLVAETTDYLLVCDLIEDLGTNSTGILFIGSVLNRHGYKYIGICRWNYYCLLSLNDTLLGLNG